MKNEITLHLRQFPVLAHDHRTGTEEAITVTVTKDQLRAAQVVGQSSKELIERLCDRQGYSVFEIGNFTYGGGICPLLSIARAIDRECEGMCVGPVCAWWGDGRCSMLTLAVEVEGQSTAIDDLADAAKSLSISLDNLDGNGITVYDG